MRQGKTHTGSWEENPSNHAIMDENKAPKTRRKTRILEKLRSGSTTNDFAESDKQALYSKTYK
jgi:hypothetical protein